MNRLLAKSLVLFFLLASLSGVPLLSPKQDLSSGPGAVPDRADAALAAQAGGPKRLDFNGDGYEDILWRYYGTGGSNRVWLLGGAEGTQPLGASDPGMTSGAAGKSPKRGAKRTPTPRDMGLVSRRKGGALVKEPEALMGGVDRRNQGSAMVQDPRQAGGGSYEFSLIVVTDPRQVGAVVEVQGAPPPLQGGADVLPVGDPNWQIVGAADFDNDTQTDILWRNVTTGTNVVWYMNGTDWSSSAELLPVQDLSWQIVGTGDFNSDTHVDILWRNIADGTNVVWYINGAEWSSSAVLLGVGDLDWQIVGTGDFNNDTHVDILWRYYGEGGANVVWYMNDASWIGSAELIPVADLSWQIMGTGDYNDDGSADILWRYNGEGGPNVIWYMTGASWAGSAELLPVSDLSWKVAGRGGFADRYQAFEAVLDPAGGSYFFPNGITLEVPAGAVSAPTTVATRLVAPASIDAFINRYGLVTKHCLAAFDGTPHGLTFSQPVRVKMRTKPLPTLNSIPLHYKADLEHEIADYATTDLDFNTRTNIAEFTLTDFSLHLVPADELQLTLDDCLLPGSCRCGWISALETSVDREVSGECHAIEVSGIIKFHDCPLAPEEPFSFSDIEYGWIEAPAPDPVKVGDEMTVGGKVYNASGQEVTTARITYTWASEADKDIIGITPLPGTNQAQIRGLKCGTARVRAEAGCGNWTEIIVDVWSEVTNVAVEPPTAEMGINTDLNLRAILFNDEGEDDETLKDPVEWVSSNPELMSVTGGTGRAAEAHSYSTDEEVTVMITAKSGCDLEHLGYAYITVKPLSVEISPAVVPVGIGEVKTLTVTVRDSDGNIIEDPPITWETSAVGIVDVPAPGDVRGVSGGWAWISATCQGVSGWALAGVPTQGIFVVHAFPGDEVELLGLNNVGQIVGETDGNCILDQNTGYSFIGDIGFDYAIDINDQGKIAGMKWWYINDEGWTESKAALYDPHTGEITDFSIPLYSWSNKINHINQIVGMYDYSPPIVHYFKYDIDTGVFEDLGPRPLEEPPIQLLGIAINDNEQMVTTPYTGINNAGHMVGIETAYFMHGGELDAYFRGFYIAGEYSISISLAPMTDDDENTYFGDINDFDQIIAIADVTPTGRWSYLLTPCPFPWALGQGKYPPFLPKRPAVPGESLGSGIKLGTPAARSIAQGPRIPKYWRKSSI